MQHVRVRFAPSPTGHLHIGGFRSALFNYLFARHNNGTYLLRIEDTDIERSKQIYLDSILAAFTWCGIVPDEQVEIQSMFIDEHKALIQQLLDAGKAYRCYCTQEEVAARYQQAQGTTDLFVKYDGKCRTMQELLDKPFAVRFALPSELKEISFHDLIRGEVVINIDQLDDFIIARSDGTPMYNFVVVVDDMRMRITHVIRGEEHIINTPKQLLLYHAFGHHIPHFAHIPLILGKDGSKLSKRDAATSIVEYIEAGYLPDAFINYFARLGWSRGDQEIFSREELVQYFTLEQVGKKGAIFDQEKLDWVNSIYLRGMKPFALFEYIERWIDRDFRQKTTHWDIERVYRLIDLYKERVKTVKELAQLVVAAVTGPEEFKDSDMQAYLAGDVPTHIQDLIEMLEHIASFDVDLMKENIKRFCTERNLGLAVVAQPVRIALVGTVSSPGIFDLLAIFGKQESVHRLQQLVRYATQAR